MCSLRRLYLRHQHTTRQSLTVQVTGRQPLAELVYVRGGFHKAYLRSHNRLPTRNPFMACCHTCAQRNGMNMDESKTYELYRHYIMMIISRYCEFVAYDALIVDKAKGHDRTVHLNNIPNMNTVNRPGCPQWLKPTLPVR